MSISIVIPSFDQELYLEEAIESCLAQTKKPHEIIVVDDGSTDHSLELARKYESKGVKVISQTNRGLSSARNTGIMNATGTWILPLDADDVLQNNAVETLSKYNSDDVDIVAPSFRCFGTREGVIQLMPNPTIEDFKEANRVGYCALIRKSALLEVGGYSSKMTFGYEDLHLWFNLLQRGKKLVTLPDILWNYRTKEKSMIHDAIAHHIELMTQIRKDFPHVTNIINNPLPQ